MSDKVYIVTRGEYSDYRICAVFSTEERAKEYIGEAPEDLYYGVEAVDVDTERPLQFGDQWVVILRIDGSVDTDFSETEKEISSEMGLPHRGYGKILTEGIADAPQRGCFQGVSVISRDHALKIAAEQRQAFLRECPDIAAAAMKNLAALEVTR